MNSAPRHLHLAVLAVVAAAGLLWMAACSMPMSEADVRSRMTAYLHAWNGRDYAGWTEGWSAPLLADSSESEWRVWRDATFELTGRFETIDELRNEPLPEGLTRWTAICTFEQARLAFTIVLPTTGGEVVTVALGAAGSG